MKRNFYKNIVLTAAVFLITLLITYIIGQVVGINVITFKSIQLFSIPIPVLITSAFILIKFNNKDQVKPMFLFWSVLLVLIILLNFIGFKFYFFNQID